MRRLEELWDYLDLDAKKNEIAKLEKETFKDDFWDDQQSAQSTLKQISYYRQWLDEWNKLHQEASDLEILYQMAVEEDDDDAYNEALASIESLTVKIEKLELRKMLGGEDDFRNAFLSIHPGAGGTESADWAGMILRMYIRYFERAGFKYETLDLLHFEIAGIKSATMRVIGGYAYGYLKSESGIHRLVRISPFDSNGRRHTSFASVFVMPEIDVDLQVDINPADLRIDTYRASGAGGQHVNKTDSAVRITHIPTNIVVTCQSERSQLRNKENAMKILAAKLYQKKKVEEEERLEHLESGKKKISWGSQIRSYVFHPYNLVKDHRTGVETGNVNAVMDGEIDIFVKEYLIREGSGDKKD
ncbi:MAG: peptide chain release factor 2 [FCB group bacterium]|nr:peptide chain release factor 2 [FCB group bacterium]